MKEISNWLKNPNRNPHAGAALLLSHSKNKRLALMISKKVETPYYAEKLEYELKKLLQQSVKVVPPKPKPKQKKRKPAVVSEEMVTSTLPMPKERFTALQFSNLPEQIQQLERQWKDLYKKRAFLRSRLEVMKTDAERHEAAKLILEMGKTITGIHIDLDYYVRHGQLPVSTKEETAPDDTLYGVEQELRRCRSRISKLKRKKKPTAEQEQKLQQEQALKLQLELKRDKLKHGG